MDTTKTDAAASALTGTPDDDGSTLADLVKAIKTEATGAAPDNSIQAWLKNALARIEAKVDRLSTESGTWLSREETAKYLGVSRWTIYEIERSADPIPRVMVGKRARYRKQDIDDWMARHQTTLQKMKQASPFKPKAGKAA